MPTDPSFRELSDNEELLHFTAHWLRHRDRDFLENLTRILGVRWTRQDIKAMTGEKKSAVLPNEVFVPLAAGVNPELVKGLQKLMGVGEENHIAGGEYVPAPGEKVTELGDLPPEEFLRFINQATDTMKEVAQEEEKRQRLVTIKEGIGDQDDPRMAKILDQIAHSKRLK